MTDALDVPNQAGIVEAIALVGFRPVGCLSTCRKAFDNVELLLDEAELILLMSRCGVAAAIDDSQRE
ncbi:hypothetical protein AO356_00200 [Pseudomonas fluorescens]|uniref:Uncharacterized protein n=1 Tax=Pseudomonas fluorescens TaxID=294 RepID=A0A0N9VWT2_PSEFL|nr:hypothetical protein AO356_00200 [Pseudomonas fluorescens]